MADTILYIATSKDGFIADKDGGVDWLPQASDQTEDFGYQTLLDRVDNIFMGSKSYEQILTFGEWAWPDKTTYVFTSKNLKPANSSIKIIKDTPHDFMKNFDSGNSWLLGGAELVQSFAKDGLIDEVILTVVPTILKEGIKLNLDLHDFKKTSMKKFKNDIEMNIYHRK
jgi:dihydrofolate reductase